MRDLKPHGDTSVFVLAIALSILISSWCVYTDNVIDNDGVVYLHAARLLTQGHWDALLTVDKWPFYSSLIALVSVGIRIPVDVSLYILNTFLAILMVISFMAVIRSLGANRASLVTAMLVALFYPTINEYRASAGQDLGYVSFYLLSIVFFMRYSRYPSVFFGVGWVGALAVATMFRVEAIAFVGYFLLFLHRGRLISSAKGVISTTLALGFFAATVAALVWWTWSPAVDDGNVIPSVPEALKIAWGQLINELSDKVDAIERDLLGRFSGQYAQAVLILALVVIVVVETVSKLTPTHVLLVGYSLHRRIVFPDARSKCFWYGLVLCNLYIASVVVVVDLFSTERYSAALPLTLLIAAPFGLAHLYDGWRAKNGYKSKGNWMFATVLLLFMATGFKSLDTISSRGYIKEAGLWLKHNTQAQASVLSNTSVINFYADKPIDSKSSSDSWNEIVKLIRNGEWRRYDVLAVHLKHGYRYREPRLLELLKRKPIKVFEGPKGSRVLLFNSIGTITLE
ncbi:MAG: hypothetical protein OEU36_00205 [Gammaproteobacteria bacterium]|nr:hypothetical protein [Gammaproteobacteria bacterium]